MTGRRDTARAPGSARPIGSRLARAAGSVAALRGRDRLLVAFGAGLVSAAATAPLCLFPVLWLTFPVLVWLIDGAPGADALGRMRGAAAAGWGFGFGYFLGGLWWIAVALTAEPADFAWLIPVAVLALPAFLGLFFGLAAGLARLFWSDDWRRILVFAAALSLAEWLRGHILTGFPWNAVGYALTPVPVMMQSAAAVGLWGLTLLAGIVFAAPAAATGRGGRPLLAFAAAAFLLHVGFGAWRLAGAEDGTVEGVRLRIVQPSIDQADKWDAENEDVIVARYLRLSGLPWSGPDAAGMAPTLVVWPESALPFLVAERADVLAGIASVLDGGASLVTGAARAVPGAVFNSVLVIDDEGVIRHAYDKRHLVPFGEYLPFESLLGRLGLRQIVELPGGFAAGRARRRISLAGVPSFVPLICYEIIFPGEAVDIADRPGWLLNVTNDTWYGRTPGPYQHLLQARVRAVEEGLPLVRAANSGISAVVDAHGRIRSMLNLGVTGIIDEELPARAAAPLYARHGDAVFLVLLGFVAVVAAVRRRP